MLSKRTIITASVAAMMATAIAASAITIREYRQAPAERMILPVRPDSTERENPFKIDDLLESRGNATGEEMAAWETVTTDSSGVVTPAQEKGVTRLLSYASRIRADRYAKGKLIANSTSRLVIKVNGNTLTTKSTADSLPSDISAAIELLPETTYDLRVDLLSSADDPSAAEFKLEFVADEEYKDVEVKTSATLPRRAGVMEAIGGLRANGIAMSDNGKYLLVKEQQVVSDQERVNVTKVVESATGKVITEGINADGWIPCSQALYTMVSQQGAWDIYRTEVPSMQTKIIAHGIPDSNVTFSPDGRYLYYYKRAEGSKQAGPMHRYSTPDNRQPGDDDRYYIMRYDTRSRVTTPLTYGGLSTYIYDMDRRGEKMLICSTRQTPDRYPFYSSTLMEMNLTTLATDTIIRDFPGGLGKAIYSPEATELFICAGPDAFGGIGANYAPHEIGNDFDVQGYIMNISDRKVRAMTRDFDPAVAGDIIWNHVDGKIYFVGEKGFERHIYRLDPKSGSIDELESSVPFVRGIAMGGEDALYLAYRGGSFTSDGEVWLYNTKQKKSRQIDNPLKEWLNDVEFGKMEPWKFTSQDGSEIDGWMCLPPDFQADKKYPLIVYYYGGTSPSTATFYHLYSPQVFASRGYVVYVINPSGTTGYGQEFSARHVNAWGKWTADEIIEGTKKFCADHEYVDAGKVGCIGASYGGFMTQYLQTQTDIFAAAVSHAGISNVTSYWGEGYWGYSYNSVAAAKSYPWSNPDLYTRQGSLFNADKIHTPLLLLHGTVDTNVPIGESIQLFNALKILGRDVEFITVENENHVIAGVENRKAWQNTIMAWFAKYLQGDPRWWESLYGKK